MWSMSDPHAMEIYIYHKLYNTDYQNNIEEAQYTVSLGLLTVPLTC